MHRFGGGRRAEDELSVHRPVDEGVPVLLEAVDSPHLAKHRLLHNLLRDQLNTIWRPGQEVPSREKIHQIALWSKDYLLNHFLKVDFKVFHAPPFTD